MERRHTVWLKLLQRAAKCTVPEPPESVDSFFATGLCTALLKHGWVEVQMGEHKFHLPVPNYTVSSLMNSVHTNPCSALLWATSSCLRSSSCKQDTERISHYCPASRHVKQVYVHVWPLKCALTEGNSVALIYSEWSRLIYYSGHDVSTAINTTWSGWNSWYLENIPYTFGGILLCCLVMQWYIRTPDRSQ